MTNRQNRSGVLIDIILAFDLDPSLFLKKVKSYFMDEDMLYWMEIYLTSRKQSVWLDQLDQLDKLDQLDQLDHVKANFFPSEVGVPHGVGILKLILQ